MENGESSFETNQILKWKITLCIKSFLFDDHILHNICAVKYELENEQKVCQNCMLNDEITFEEVQNVVDKAKANKAVGVESTGRTLGSVMNKHRTIYKI